MKSSIYLILLFFPILLASQVELDDSILPGVNDVYRSFIDEISEAELGRQGRDQNWDLSDLSSGLVYSSEMLAPDPVLIFNKIDYDFFSTENGSIYRMFKRVGNQIFEVAIQRTHPLNSDYVVFARYENPKLVSYAPLSYRSEKTDRSLIYYELPGNQIPSLIQKKLPVTADSLRLKISTIRDFRVDASGTLSLSSDRYDVLRQEIITRTDTDIEIYSAGRWSQINNDILDPKGEVLGESTSRQYLFYSDEERFPLVTITADEETGTLKAEIRAGEETDNYVSGDTELKQFLISPNPTYGDVKLELMNLDLGTYEFEISNIIGKQLWSDEIKVTKNFNSFRYNFNFLGKGTYLWTLTDDRGVRLTTKRLVIVTP